MRVESLPPGKVIVALHMTGWAGGSVRPIRAEVSYWDIDALVAENRRQAASR